MIIVAEVTSTCIETYALVLVLETLVLVLVLVLEGRILVLVLYLTFEYLIQL